LKALRLEKVSKNFGGFQALSDVYLDVELGERRALIGPNGAGKTTLFNIINGILNPSSGRVFIFEKDVTRLPPHKRAILGLGRTFQITNLFLNLTVVENLLLSLNRLDDSKAFLKPLLSYRSLVSKAESLLDQFKLRDRKNVRVSVLSYGEQRQIEILMAVAQGAKILLLDEPTSGLTPEEGITLSLALEAMPGDITLLVIEHDMGIAFRLGERITVLHWGKVLAEGTGEEIKRNTQIQQIYLGGPKG
jgi:branched-chain amino acid transport system ATP-binding protein